MSAAIMWAKRLAIIVAAFGSATIVHAEKRENTTFRSIYGTWKLKIRNGEGQFTEKGSPQTWRGRLEHVTEGNEVKSTFAWRYIAAGEADALWMELSMIFTKEDCRDSKGRSFPFSITLHFENSPAERGCGKRLP